MDRLRRQCQLWQEHVYIDVKTRLTCGSFIRAQDKDGAFPAHEAEMESECDSLSPPFSVRLLIAVVLGARTKWLTIAGDSWNTAAKLVMLNQYAVLFLLVASQRRGRRSLQLNTPNLERRRPMARRGLCDVCCTTAKMNYFERVSSGPGKHHIQFS